jgi:predicted nucleic acid-binding protein
MRKVDALGPAEALALAERGVFDIALSVREHWSQVEGLMRKNADRPISLAAACLIRCAELHDEARIITFDEDFSVYRWARNKKFQILK